VFKYLVAIILILALWVMAQRGCRGIGDRFRDRMDGWRQHRQERFEGRREQKDQGSDEDRRRIFDGHFFDRIRKL
jgi:hypothetical protein